MSAYEWQMNSEGIDWSELSELYRRAPLGNKSASDLQTVFKNSRFNCFVFDNLQLVAAGRCLADGVDCAYVCDVAVLPEYQGKGLGKAIVGWLVEQAKDHRKIMLYSVPGTESFYQKLGFKRMNTALAIFQDEKSALRLGLIAD